MLQLDGAIHIGDVITLAALLVTTIGFWRAQARRDAKIDLVLFGVDGKNGLHGDVKWMKRAWTTLRVRLAGLGIDIEEHSHAPQNETLS